MKLNLKKVISSIAALAMTASVLVAPVSAKFADVADTAKYAQAVEEIAALGIVAGDADTGLFRPEDNITRAEATKMVVAAMGPAYTEAAEGAKGTDTEFSDVPGSHWASGFVTTGVANSFINGMGDGTFAPEENVTYAQIVKMIVAAMGYTTICDNAGGYPGGYLTTAANIGVTAGVGVNGADTVVTRGQVSMILANAINTPIVAIGSYDEDYKDNSLTANIKVMDDITAGGNAEDYRTLLTENHDAFKVKGRITATKKSNTTLKNGEVKFNVESAKNFDDRAYGASYYAADEFTMKYAGTDAEALMFSYAEAIIQRDEDDNWNILTVFPTGSNKATTLDASLLDASTVTDFATKFELDFYQAADSDKTDTYEFATVTDATTGVTSLTTQLYVNGVKIGTITAANVRDYIQNNKSGVVTFIDQTETGKTTTDGKIDFVLVDYYVDAVVSSVVEGTTYRVYVKDQSPAINKGVIKVDTEDEDITATFTLDGEEIDYTELTEGDVLSVAYNVKGNFADSKFYDVKVSRDTVTGRVDGTTEDNNGDTLYKINGEKYAMSTMANATPISAGKSYVLYLNVFGQYVAAEEDTTVANIGILDGATITAADELSVTFIDTTGNKKTLAVKDSLRTELETKVDTFYTAFGAGTNKYQWANRKALANRLVKYSISSDGYLTGITTLAGTDFTALAKEYKAAYSKMGSYLLSDSTVVIDLSDNEGDVANNAKATKVSAITVADLTDGVNYKGIVLDKSNLTGAYRVLIITEGESAYTANTAIAVYQGSGSSWDDSYGRTVQTVEAYMNGVYADEETESGDVLLTAFTASELAAKNLVPGSVFIYQTNADGYVDQIDVIYDGPESDYADFMANVAAVTSAPYSATNAKLVWDNTTLVADWAATNDDTKSGNVEILFGAVAGTRGSTVQVAQIGTVATATGSVVGYDIEAADDFTVNSDANIYVYDYSTNKVTSRVYIGSQILATNAGYKVAGAGSETDNVVPLQDNDGDNQTINFIFAKVVDDNIAEALVILGK